MLNNLLITGYKPHELGVFDEKHPGIPFIKKAIKRQLLTLLEDGLEWVIVSGQLGVETWAIDTVLELQPDFPNLKYAIITPFLEQEKNWNEAKQEKYRSMVAMADYHVSLTKKPYEAPWQFIEKDKFLLRNTDGLLIVFDEETGGSPKYMMELARKYAETTDYEIFTVNAFDLQLIAEEEMWDKFD